MLVVAIVFYAIGFFPAFSPVLDTGLSHVLIFGESAVLGELYWLIFIVSFFNSST